MNKLVWISCVGVATVLTACREVNQEATPDLASPLVGKFNVTYLIAGPMSQTRQGGTGSFVRLERKSNNTLLVKVRIDDGMVQVNDQYEARITPVSLQAYSQQEAGLRSRYSLTAANLSPLGGESVSQISLFQDGTIRAALGYVNSLGQTVSLGVNL